MAFVTITTTTDFIEVNNGVYAGMDSPVGRIPKKSVFPKTSIIRLSLEASESWIAVAFAYDSAVFILTWDGTTGRKIDSVDGIAPTSNSDLYDKIKAIL
jgi:hypothetical protein